MNCVIIIGLFYQSVIVIIFGVNKRDHIKRLPLIGIYIGYCIRNSENRKIDLTSSEPKSELYECSFLFSYNVNQQKIIVLIQG